MFLIEIGFGKRYFYVRDEIENNKLKLKYTPTNEMTADGLTKPGYYRSSYNKKRNKRLWTYRKFTYTKMHNPLALFHATY